MPIFASERPVAGMAPTRSGVALCSEAERASKVSLTILIFIEMKDVADI
ncbi:MAG: hypothetical protein WAM14_26625 [Candidatus Nitrosopolaris sp.]